jgi:hypothetical protein
VQAIATWLVARPQNAVMGLAVTLLLPAPQLTSGVIMALLVVAQGTRLAAFEGLIAAAVLVAVSLVFGVSIASITALMLGTWVPVFLLAALLLRTRSLTLVMQVSVLVAVVALTMFYIVVTDPVAFWQPYLVMMAELAKQSNLQLNMEMFTPDVMTVSAVLAFWLLYVVGLLLGYALYQRLPGETGDYGRFRDFGFGRVIAIALALASLLAFVVDVAWIQNLAFILFVFFWLQGLAIVHWLHAEGILPIAAVIAVYILLPFLQILLMTALALFGYTDAWFNFRRRIRKA